MPVPSSLTNAPTAEAWIKAAEKLPVDGAICSKLEAATRKAADMPLVSALALLSLCRLKDATIAALGKKSGRRITSPTMKGLRQQGYARRIDGPCESWRMTVAGLARADRVRAGVETLMTRLRTPKS